MKPGKKTLEALKVEIYQNAVRLFHDACHLYSIKSYPSAFALSVLSFEEIGKLEMVDHICDDIRLNPDHDPQLFLSHLFSRHVFRSHKNKQAWAFTQTLLERGVRILDSLERDKQNAFYVNYTGRQIVRPRCLPAKKAFAQIRKVHKALNNIGDLGFNGFDCWSTAASRKRANRVLKHVETSYEAVIAKKPRKKALFLSRKGEEK